LFHRSLAESIADGQRRATLREIERAARLAHAEEFIAKLARGNRTLVGERGVKLSGGELSGGERQRIAIARTLLADAPIRASLRRGGTDKSFGTRKATHFAASSPSRSSRRVYICTPPSCARGQSSFGRSQ
jgi:predicted ABC-type transport system involved in lysophospholipase L1 biosynthesis ATPase subunit